MSDPKKTEFLHLSPVMASSDIVRDIKWYETKLGFKNVYDSSKYDVAPLNYVVLWRQGLFFHMQFQFPKDMISTDLKFAVKNIEPLIEEFSSTGVVKPENVQKKTPWNTCEFSFFDPSGNRLTFLEDL